MNIVPDNMLNRTSFRVTLTRCNSAGETPGLLRMPIDQFIIVTCFALASKHAPYTRRDPIRNKSARLLAETARAEFQSKLSSRMQMNPDRDSD